MAFILLTGLALVLQEPTDDDIRDLVKKLGSDFKEDREKAKEELVKLGAKAEKQLEEGISNEDARVKLACVDILRQLGNTSQVKKIGDMFEGGADEETQVVAFDYLRQAGQAAEDYLIRALNKGGTYFKKGALEKLKEIKSKAAAKPAFDLYSAEEDAAVRRAAFELIKALGADAKQYLVKFVADPEAQIRRESVDGLKGVYEDEVLATVGRALKAELDDNVIGAIFDYLKDAPAEKVEDFVLQALDAQSSKTKSRAIQILALNKCEKALDRVLDTAKKTPELEVKLECIAFFAVFPDKTEAYMIKLLEDQNSQIRNKVINELAAKKSKAAYEKIHEVYRKDAEKDVRSNAFRYFLSLGAEAADVLMEGLKDDQGDIKEAAIEGLGELRLETAIEPLLEACRKDKSKPIQDRCVSALAKIGKKAIAAAEAAAKADPAMEPIATGVSQQYDDVVVETVLSKFITDKETTGWFAGQFKELSTLEIGKDRTAAVLIRMHGDNYEPRTKKLFELRRVQLLNRVATLALGELGGTKSTEFLLQKFDALLKNPEYDGLIEEIGVGLVHAGEKAVLDRLVERIQKEVDARLKEDKAGAFERQFSIGSVRNRAGDVKGALAAYQTLEKSMAADAEKDPFLYAKVHYNISCAHSLLGDKAAAVDHLRKAVESGFKDKEWIEIDKDLDAIRGEEGYKRLIADEKLFRED